MKDKTLSDGEILKKAIEKAVKNGYRWTMVDADKKVAYLKDISPKSLGWMKMMSVIFDHDFAKAFWGEQIVQWTMSTLAGTTMTKSQPEWEHQLQTMVLEDNPVKYLEQFL